jgi:hypothetical protein
LKARLYPWLRPSNEALPVELHGKLEAIIHDLTKTQAQENEGTIRATLRTISDEEHSKLARRIFSLYIELGGGI